MVGSLLAWKSFWQKRRTTEDLPTADSPVVTNGNVSPVPSSSPLAFRKVAPKGRPDLVVGMHRRGGIVRGGGEEGRGAKGWTDRGGRV